MLNSFWNWFVILVVIVSILACWWLLHWTKGISDREDEDDVHDTGHVWDNDIRELNNPLPRWWLHMFNLTIVFGFVYLALFPGLGNIAGILGWTQDLKYENQMAAAEAEVAGVYQRYAAMSHEELMRDEAGMDTARRLWGQNCAMCHGSDARGGRGFPNLRDAEWQWGDGVDNVMASIVNGRKAAMPPWAPSLGEDGVAQVTEYVVQMSGQEADAELAALGQQKYAMFCVACHGADGKGNPALGAPNLTNQAWVYGGDRATIREGLHEGRYGVMPAFGEQLSEARIRLLTAYVLGLSDGGNFQGASN
jgi:cytochrome c oxidase cbb3-type subunit 3